MRGFALGAVLLFFLCARQANANGQGERLYIERGCVGCHGASGHGALGLALAETKLSLDEFVSQLRSPRGIMPAFDAAALTDADALAIFDFVRQVPAATRRLRKDRPRGEQSPKSCAECHRALHPTIVRQFEGSAMGAPERQNPRVDYPLDHIDCATCHGTNHDDITATRGRVPEQRCAACHAQIYQEHVTGAGHSYGPGPGELGINWERNIGVPHYPQMPRAVMEVGCDACHAQAGATDERYWSEQDKRYKDTSSLAYRNGCMACHTRHGFSLVEARKPEACYTCHMGPDHPNYEAYMSSKHGSIYVALGDGWDFSTPLADAAWDAPTCAYCHMLYVDDDGTRRSSHDMTRKIIWGMGVQPALGQLTDITHTPQNAVKRDEMIKVCLTCHSEAKARGYLESADAHKLAGDALVIEAREILKGLYDDGLIEVGQTQRSAGLLPGPRFSAVELPGGFAQHSPASLYYDVTPIELEYFDLFFFSALKSYKGAFHMSPDYAWWYGYADVLGRLATIRHEASRIRSEHAVARRTSFMLLTGPLMVLAVIGAIALVVRALRRRKEG